MWEKENEVVRESEGREQREHDRRNKRETQWKE